jgi:hypothetical protein
LLVASGEAEFRLRSTVGSQLVGHEHLWREALLLQLFAHELDGCSLVASPLHEQVENLALTVHRSPDPKLLAADRHGHLVEMPLRGRAGGTAAKLPSKQGSELQHPAPDRLVGNVEIAFREEFLNVAIAEARTGHTTTLRVG